MSTKIPIVDIGNVHRFGENISRDPDCISTADKIRDGLGAVGFLYLINHGIPEETISQVMALSKNFYSLPASTKLKYKKDTSSGSKVMELDNYFGYTPPGSENLHPDSKYEVKETFDWLNNGRGVYPNEELPQFEKAMNELDMQCKKLMRKILRLLAIGLKLDDIDFFVKTCRHFDEPDKYKGIYNMRLNHYPPLSDDDIAKPGTVRCGEHSDYGFLTLLFQDDVGGLEVKTVDGKWVHAEPIPGSILVNTGDLTEFWTCGIFPATPHRIIIPDVSDARRRQSRYSAVFFNGPDTDTVITPIDMEKRPCEMDRLQKNGKVYSKDPINAFDYMFGRVAVQYGYGKPE